NPRIAAPMRGSNKISKNISYYIVGQKPLLRQLGPQDRRQLLRQKQAAAQEVGAGQAAAGAQQTGELRAAGGEAVGELRPHLLQAEAAPPGGGARPARHVAEAR